MKRKLLLSLFVLLIAPTVFSQPLSVKAVAANSMSKAPLLPQAFEPTVINNHADPVNVSSSTASTFPASEGVGGGYRLVFDQGLFWVFFSDGINLDFATSPDGLSFGSSSPIRAATDGNSFSVYLNATTNSVSYAYYPYGSSGSSLLYRTGSLNAGGSITWAASEQTVLTVPSTIKQLRPVIAVDSGGYPWIGYSFYNSSTNTGSAYIVKSSLNNGTWVTVSGFPFQLSTTTASNVVVQPVPLTNGKVLVVYTIGNQKINDKLWNGASWSAQETASANTVSNPTKTAAVNRNDDVYLVYVSGANNIQFVNRTFSKGKWSSDTTVQTGVSGSTGVTLSIDNSNILYFFWTNPSTGHIFYKRIISTVAESSATDWLNESVYGLKSGTDLISFNTQSGPYIGVSYSICRNPTTCTGVGVKVRFAFLTLSSITWQTNPVLSNTIGSLLSIDGFNYVLLPLTFNLVAGTSHLINASTPIFTIAGNRYGFLNWTNADGMNSTSNSGTYMVPSTAQTVTANYGTQFQVNITASGIWAGTKPVPLFTDDFEAYPVSGVPVAGECVNSNYLGGGNNSFTAATLPGCNSPLHQAPSFWIFASSAACTGATYPRSGSPPTGGDCVFWGNNGQMGPNSIEATVTERVQSGKQSLKLGASDWAFDKTSAAVQLNRASIPANSQVSWTIHVWVSDAINDNNNFLQYGVAGELIEYKNNEWLFQSSATPNNFRDFGRFPLTVDTWHTLAATVDLPSDKFVSFTVDGLSPFNVTGVPALGIPTSVNYGFTFAVDPAKTNQSIFSCTKNPSSCGETRSSPTLGLYAYLDNVTVNYLPKLAPISDSSDTILTINGVNFTGQSLPFSQFFTGGGTITYAFASRLFSSSVKRYVWANSIQQTNSFTVTGSVAITGIYLAQYNVNFGFMDNNGTQVLTPQPSSFTLMDSNGSSFSNPTQSWFDSGITPLIFVTWEGSNVLPPNNRFNQTFVVLSTGGTIYYYRIGVYTRSFLFDYADLQSTFTPTQVTYSAPNGTSITLLSASNYTNIPIQQGASTFSRILFWGNDVVSNSVVNNTFDASNLGLHPGITPIIIVTQIYRVTPVWNDGNHNPLTISPTSFSWTAPNGTLIHSLTSGTSYRLQNGTTTLGSVIWEGTNVAPANTMFDAANGSPVIPLNIFYLRLDHVDTSGHPLTVNIQLTVPNGTTLTIAPITGWTNITQVQNGTITSLTPIIVNSTSQYSLQSPSTIAFTGNLVQQETWMFQSRSGALASYSAKVTQPNISTVSANSTTNFSTMLGTSNTVSLPPLIMSAVFTMSTETAAALNATTFTSRSKCVLSMPQYSFQ